LDLEQGTRVVYKSSLRAAYNYQDYEFMRMDALIAEKMTSKPNIVDIYGFCGLANLNEAMGAATIEDIAQPTERKASTTKLNDTDHLGPQNSLAPSQKLMYALEMAESIAELTGYSGGVIVHDDVQMSQWLLTQDMHLKLNDFNRAEILLWDEEYQEYCRYRNYAGEGDWRAPEEYLDVSCIVAACVTALLQAQISYAALHPYFCSFFLTRR
jgi:hypothetical protein